MKFSWKFPVLDFWHPDPPYDLPKLNSGDYEELDPGEVDSWPLGLRFPRLLDGVSAPWLMRCRKTGWHKDRVTNGLPMPYSYALVLESDGQLVQCNDGKPDAIDQRAGLIFGFDITHSHRLFSPHKRPAHWVALYFDSANVLGRGDVELMLWTAAKLLSL